MARLPQPGGDAGNWGDILNDYLATSHKADGTIKDNTVGAAQLQDDSVTTSTIADGTITETLLASAVQTKLNAPATIADGSITNAKLASDAISKGQLQPDLRTEIDGKLTQAEANDIYAPAAGYDIIPILGQSNALGRGTAIDLTYLDGADPRVLQFANLLSPYADQVVAALDPLHHHEMPGNTVGFALTFAKRYVQTRPITRKVLLVPCAHGNTGFGSTGTYTWRVGQAGPINLYSLAVEQINKALALPGDNRVAAILWHQGEANSATSAASYRADLDSLIDDLRVRYGASTPFVLGQMSPLRIAENAGYATIDGVHRDTPTRRQYVGMWEAVSMLEQDNVHFSAPGQRINGMTAFDAYELALSSAGGIAPAPEIAPVELGFSDDFNRVNGIITTTPNGAPYQIFDTGSNASTWVIDNNAARYSGEVIRSLIVAESGTANGILTGTVGAIGSATNGLAARVQDAGNYIALECRQSAGVNRVRIVKRVAGTLSTVGTAASDKLSAPGSVLELVLDGVNVSLKLNGEVVVPPTVVSEFVSNTKHGMFGLSTETIQTFDSLAFVPA